MTRKEYLPGLPKSSIGYGCYALSGAYGTKLEDSQKIKILQYAFELGIRFFDTAGTYGDTEKMISRAIKSFRHEITIASKVGLTINNRINLSKEHVIASCESSLKNLNTDYLDVYQVHYDDPKTPVVNTIEALERLKKEGKIRFYGIGHLPLNRTLEYLKLGNVSTIMAEMNIATTSRYKELRPLQENHDFDIIAFSVTGRGLLTGAINSNFKFKDNDIRNMDPLFKKSKLSSGIRMVEKLKEIGNRYGMSPAQTAISWVIQNPGVTVALTGPIKIEHIRENYKVQNWTLDNAGIEEINQLIKKEEDKLKECIYKEILNILNSPLVPDFDKAFNDLVYVLDYTIENKLIPYEVGIGLYLSLSDAKMANHKSLPFLEEIKSKLNTLI